MGINLRLFLIEKIKSEFKLEKRLTTPTSNLKKLEESVFEILI